MTDLGLQAGVIRDGAHMHIPYLDTVCIFVRPAKAAAALESRMRKAAREAARKEAWGRSS